MDLDRRALLRLAGAGALGGLAGCGGNGGNDGGRSAEDLLRGEGMGDPTERSGSNLDGLEGTVLALSAPLARQPQVNPFAFRNTGMEILRQFHGLVMPMDRSTGTYLTSGHTRTVAGEEISVPCMVAEYEREGGEAVTYSLDDRFSYWNGDPVTAEAFLLRDKLDFLINYGGVNDSTFESEQRGDYEYRYVFPTELDRSVVRAETQLGPPPLPPSFTRPWIQRFEDASTSDAVDAVYGELNGVQMTFATYAEEGYGTGVYALESGDDVTDRNIVARRREDHPSPAPAPNLVLQRMGGVGGVGAYEIEQKGIDLGDGVIAANGGAYTPDAMADYIEQLGRYRLPVGGYKLAFNWGDDHLRRLPVRRALVAAVGFDDVLDSAVGETAAAPVHDSGMLSRGDERALGESFCDALHNYPTEADAERAAEWLREAGYSRQDGGWVGPDGNALSVSIPTTSDPFQTDVAGAVGDALSAFGVAVEQRTVTASGAGYPSILRDGEYGIAVSTVGPGWSPADQYAAPTGVTDGWLSGSSLAAGNSPLDSCGDGSNIASIPAEVTLPEEPGALRIEGVDYGKSGDRYVHDAGETVSLCADAASLTEPDIDDESFRRAARRCARWYNYALPSFVFGQARRGVWGNVEEFSFPEGPALRTAGGVASPVRYLVQGGLVR